MLTEQAEIDAGWLFYTSSLIALAAVVLLLWFARPSASAAAA
jgi:hypothetical protein